VARWDVEPNLEEWFNGEYHCIIVRSELKTLCGFVGVNMKHPLYNKPHSNIEFSPHRRLTYSGNDIEDMLKGYWYFGFHCAHVGDFIPGYKEEIKELEELAYSTRFLPVDFFCAYKELSSEFFDSYKNFHYVKQQINLLVQKCVEYKKG
jgi:hypothetical protein